MNLKSDEYLLDKIKIGDDKGYDLLFLKYYKMLCVNAYFYLKDEQESKDLVQTFFLEFWEKKLYTKLEGEIKGYLYRSIQNRCFNHIRHQESVLKKQVVIDVLEETYEIDKGSIKENLYAALEKKMLDLPLQRREALKMVYLENKRYQDAADSMGISINSLKTHLKIGLKNLRESMKNANEFTCITVSVVYIMKYICI